MSIFDRPRAQASQALASLSAFIRPGANDANLSLLSLAPEFASALDYASEGITILDSDLRVIYSNRAFRQLFHVSDALANSQPEFAAIVACGRRAGVYELEQDKLEDFCAQRVAYVRSGNPQAVTLRLAGNSMIRFKCCVLPNGGRTLTYTNITDLVDEAKRLEELAHIDGMTGLINRRHLFALAEEEWARDARYSRPLSALMIDIDHFKNINDTYGHAVGDHAICHVATICKDSKRSTDTVARFGGEEFVLLLPETSISGATILAERIRSRVEANPFRVVNGSTRLTVSIGVSTRTTAMLAFEDMFSDSDQMLYQAKRNGRNQVAFADIGDVEGSASRNAGAALRSA